MKNTTSNEDRDINDTERAANTLFTGVAAMIDTLHRLDDELVRQSEDLQSKDEEITQLNEEIQRLKAQLE
jgi:peptidoglycan hydrolase CwlO-like protein